MESAGIKLPDWRPVCKVDDHSILFPLFYPKSYVFGQTRATQQQSTYFLSVDLFPAGFFAADFFAGFFRRRFFQLDFFAADFFAADFLLRTFFAADFFATDFDTVIVPGT